MHPTMTRGSLGGDLRSLTSQNINGFGKTCYTPLVARV